MNKYKSHDEAFWAVILQSIFFVIVLLFLSMMNEKIKTLSFAFGFLVCLMPNFIFYFLFFRYRFIRRATAIKNRFYFGGLVKFVLVFCLFALIWQITWVNPVWVFWGYITSLATFFLPVIIISFSKLTKQQRV